MSNVPEDLKNAGPIVETCFNLAAEVLHGRRDAQGEDGKYHLTKDEMLAMLSGAAVRGFSAGVKEVTGYLPNGPAIEHGRKVRVVTAKGKKLPPPEGVLARLFSWLR